MRIKRAYKTIQCVLSELISFFSSILLSFSVRQENERLMQETMSRSKPAKNFTHAALIAPLSVGDEIP